jgi:hypothetical protein
LADPADHDINFSEEDIVCEHRLEAVAQPSVNRLRSCYETECAPNWLKTICGR